MNAFNISAREKREKSHVYSIENEHPFSVILLIWLVHGPPLDMHFSLSLKRYNWIVESHRKRLAQDLLTPFSCRLCFPVVWFIGSAFPSVAEKAVKKFTRKDHQSNIKKTAVLQKVKLLPTFSIYHAIKNVTQPSNTQGEKRMKNEMRFLWYHQPISVGSNCYGTDGSLYSLLLAIGLRRWGCCFKGCEITGGNLSCVCVSVNQRLPVVFSVSCLIVLLRQPCCRLERY